MHKTDIYFIIGLVILIAVEVFLIFIVGGGEYDSFIGLGFIAIFIIVWIIELIERNK